MKLKVTLLALSSLFISSLFAKPVSVETARQVAQNFFSLNTGSPVAAGQVVMNYTKSETDQTVDFYVFDINGSTAGFVIVSGDDNIVPVLAWSRETRFNNQVANTGVEDWMYETAAEIHQLLSGGASADEKIRNEWTAYENNAQPAGPRTASLGPLILTLWNQSPFYNDLCPYDNAQQARCVTGCVATTMAQIMKFWNYPMHGTGSHSYNAWNYGTLSANFGTTTYAWNNMPFSLNSANNDIAQLMLQCGISVDMGYSPTGSGAQVLGGDPSAQYALVNYFGYANTIQGLNKSSYSSNAWTNMIKADLDLGHPVEYVGSGPEGGHTWVCDGYDSNNLLHMNWGWGGADDGYFTTSNLSAGGTTFNSSQQVLLNIHPPAVAHVSATVNPGTFCPGDIITLTATGDPNATYFWQPTTGLSCPTCQTTTAHPTGSVTYSVTKDSAGFAGNYHFLVTPQTAPLITPSAPDTHLCTGDSASLSASGGVNYVWSPAATLSCSNCNNPYAFPTSNTTYTVVGTSTTNGCTGSGQIQIVVSGYPAVPTITLSGSTLTTNTAAFHYQWFNAAGDTIQGATAQSFSPAVSGTYYLVISNAGGCSATSNTLEITVTNTGVVSYTNHAFRAFVADNQIYAVMDGWNGYDTRFRLVNCLGQVVAQQVVSTSNTAQVPLMNIAALPAGIYFLQAEAGAERATTRIVKP